ncbi:E3 ubiquitin-protein ligase RNF31 [Eumeta japonica]|uniref:E3 ubiquitin-protein ligase RNF31 n=1 Tax=Eumeta variegata TaxID=151549 RepID=A0A4C1YNW2_EUMVA|nr:E3 ubiquitin-protein ligase RNF31 [Eumeta japonica]
MLASSGRTPRGTMPRVPPGSRPGSGASMRPLPPVARAPLARPEPDYEVVEFPSEQYVNARLQPPPPPPRPPTLSSEVATSCGLCGGGGARVRCAECGRRALCASCDEMYHRHPKRRHHLRQAIAPSQPAQVRDVRPPLPPKASAPVPPPRRHKVSGDRMSASPMPTAGLEQRRATVGAVTVTPAPVSFAAARNQQTYPGPSGHGVPLTKSPVPMSSAVPYPPNAMQAAAPPQMAGAHASTLSHASVTWGRTRPSIANSHLTGQPTAMWPTDAWEPENANVVGTPSWNRPLRRGASVLELGANGSVCNGPCMHCSPFTWRYGSCANLEHPQVAGPWVNAWPPACCAGPHPPPGSTHSLHHRTHAPVTPQPYRESRTTSRTASRAASPAVSVRSRTSRRAKLRSPSPPLPSSSDADSEDNNDDVQADLKPIRDEGPPQTVPTVAQIKVPNDSWQCEHCTFVNEGGGRICAVCCRTSTAVVQQKVTENDVNSNLLENLSISDTVAPAQNLTVPEEKTNNEDLHTKHRKERVSTGCGPSPPREAHATISLPSQQEISTQDKRNSPISSNSNNKKSHSRHDVSVGSSPPRVYTRDTTGTGTSPPRQTITMRQNVSVGSSPPRKNCNELLNTSQGPSSTREKDTTSILKHDAYVGPSPPRESTQTKNNTSETSPSEHQYRGNNLVSRTSNSTKSTSTTGTSPPPQSISTQTYEVPQPRERSSSMARSRSRRRFRDESRRERSHSRVSLSSDTRESERSGRTSGGRWEWRETRDSSPTAGDWSESERRRTASRLTRRASHLDLRRSRPPLRSSFYGSEAASPEPMAPGRAISLEALAGAGPRRDAERGLELARLLGEAERAGFSAAEMHAALAQCPAAPLTWLRERWPGLCAGVRAAAARLAPGTNVSESEARNALARHRGALWSAVTECVERHRRAATEVNLGEERRLRGHVWGSPTGADDEGAPPPRNTHHRIRANESSDELEVEEPSLNKTQDNWLYSEFESDQIHPNHIPSYKSPAFETEDLNNVNIYTEDIARNLNSFLIQAGINTIDESLLLKGLLSVDKDTFNVINKVSNTNKSISRTNLETAMDLNQTENDFIDAYNALTRSSPLQNINIAPEAPITIDNNFNKRKEMNKNKIKTEVSTFVTDIVQNPSMNKMKKNHSSSSDGDSPKVSRRNSRPQSKKKIDENSDQKSSASNAFKSEDPNNQNIETKAKRSDFLLTTASNSGRIINEQSNTNDSEHEGDKTKNLTEIVGSTQKLIQQMKEEINSDMNSFDGNKSSDSESESSSGVPDCSSESNISYSDNSNNDSNDVTSNENETSTESENDSQVRPQIKGFSRNRTSSEDNEQFEEAIDHLEPTTDEYTKSNMEVLDSIVRSLQEPSVSVETVQPKHKSKNKSSQDHNNNYTPVQSFEEIYQDLNIQQNNLDMSKSQQLNIQSKYNLNIRHETKETISRSDKQKTKNNLLLAEHNIEILPFNPDTPKSVSIEFNKTPMYNAILEEHIEQLEDTLKIHSIQHIDIFPQNPTIIIRNKDKNETNKKIEEKIDQERRQLLQNAITSEDSIINNSDKSQDQFLNDSSITNSSTDVPVSVHEIIEANNNVNESNGQNEVNVHDQKNESQGQSLSLTVEESIPYVDTEDVLENYSYNEEQINEITPNNINSVVEEAIEQNSITENKVVLSIIKSNIPKPVKSLTNIKQKLEKPFTKIIASKVPIRKMSSKQYPAPMPPKSHFGNIQSGHVKHLQSRLFNKNEKSIDNSSTSGVSTTSMNNSTQIASIKPSTASSQNTKKRAPAPPQAEQLQKQQSPPNTENTKPYFRETCQTEDDWSESEEDREASDQQEFRRNSEEIPPPSSSPPLPPTVRRVSGNIIDLTTIRLPEGSPERQARMLLAEGATETWEQAQLAVDLVGRGVEAPAALLAALDCADLPAALTYLNQECELCASRLPEHEMISMLRCTHRCCRECARHYFTVQITERSIVDCACPYCKAPELEASGDDSELEYFAHLDILLKTLVTTDVHELFQRKLRDRTLARDPNFRWCVECSSGFFVHPKQKRLRCPECRSVTCASCRKPVTANKQIEIKYVDRCVTSNLILVLSKWLTQHEGVSCEQFAEWLEANDPDRSTAAVQQHLRENGLECPRCHFKYSLSRLSFFMAIGQSANNEPIFWLS